MGIVHVNCRRAENSLLYLWKTAADNLRFGKGRSFSKNETWAKLNKKAALKAAFLFTVNVIHFLAFTDRHYHPHHPGCSVASDRAAASDEHYHKPALVSLW